MPRHFNTAGPCEPDRHYMVPAVERLPEARPLIEQLGYFVLHAPRQSGKTTTLRALAKQLTAEGTYAALHFTCEGGEPAQDDYAAAQNYVLQSIAENASMSLASELRPPAADPSLPALARLQVMLGRWATSCPRPLVLIFDEIDALQGESLRSVLRQLRAGFPNRPRYFPASVVLCGLRDVRDYKAASGGDPQRIGSSSPFNVKVKSLRFGDFTETELQALYRQHTEDTGQVFTDEAIRHAFELAQGQPWLTNALAREIVEEMAVQGPITEVHMEEAKERLILARQTHLDSLVARLMEPRVRRVLGPLLAGGLVDADATFDDDISYVRDLGLVRSRPLRMANPIYREVVVRVLGSVAEENVTADPRSFVLPDGRLDLRKLLDEFAAFWTEHGEILASRLPYHEVAPQLVLMAFLQRVVNGGGYVDREYGIGRGRIDLLVRWPFTDPAGKRVWQREALELKTWADKKGDPLVQGLKQLENYLDRLGLQEGVLVLFDRRTQAVPFEERGHFEEASTAKGYRVTVLRG